MQLMPYVTFSPDGRLAVVFNFRLWFVRIDDGKKTPTSIQAESVVFSPDGRWMVVTQRQSTSIYDANGHLVRQIQPTLPIIWAAAFSKDGQRLACLWWSRAKEIADRSRAAVWCLCLANRWLAVDAVNAFDAILRNFPPSRCLCP